MKKYGQLKDEEREEIQDQVKASARTVGATNWHGPTERPRDLDHLGMCGNCKYLDIVRTEFNFMRAFCDELRFPVDPHRHGRIAKCTRFDPRGQMTLPEMFAIAAIIDPGTPSRTAGFTAVNDDDFIQRETERHFENLENGIG